MFMDDGGAFSNKFEMLQEYDPEDSVYDSTYQDFEKREHPMLRAFKLNKRIRRDKRITHD